MFLNYLKKNYYNLWVWVTTGFISNVYSRMVSNPIRGYELFFFPSDEIKNNPEYYKLVRDPQFKRMKFMTIIGWCGCLIAAVLILIVMEIM